MAWIESHQELAYHPKVTRLAALLEVDKAAAIGYLHLFWWWCLSYADDGNVSEYAAAEIADGAQWRGDPDAFLEALRGAGWVDGVDVHDWWDYAGKLVERRRSDAERKRQGRSKDVQGTSAGQPKDGVATAYVPNPTQPNRTQQEELGPPVEIVKARDEVWDTLAVMFGEPSTESNRKLRGRLVRSLKAAGATAEELVVRVQTWPLHFPDATLTETALEKHWDRLGKPPARASQTEVSRARTRQAILEGGR